MTTYTVTNWSNGFFDCFYKEKSIDILSVNGSTER